MTCSRYVPQRGDAVRITWTHKAGQEPEKHSLALVLSPAVYNERVGLALLCPITDLVKSYPFEVPIPGNMKVAGAVLSDEVYSLDWRANKAELICRIPEATVSEVLRKTAVLLSK